MGSLIITILYLTPFLFLFFILSIYIIYKTIKKQKISIFIKRLTIIIILLCFIIKPSWYNPCPPDPITGISCMQVGYYNGYKIKIGIFEQQIFKFR